MTKVAFRYGGRRGKQQKLTVSDEYMAVRTRERGSLAELEISAASRKMLEDFESVFRVARAGVEVFRCKAARSRRAIRDRARLALKDEKVVRFAGRALCTDVARYPVLYTENFFVKFGDDVGKRSCRKIIDDYGLTIKRELEYARNAYFIEAPEGCGLDVFRVAQDMLAEEDIELCHPELVRRASRREAFPEQWHLAKRRVGGTVVDQHAHVEAAWELSTGESTTIAIIDDGIDIDHEEFRGAGKIVAPRDASMKTSDPRPGSQDDHGTACAGVACANGSHGASGVAPSARLMPIRLVSDLGSQEEADSFVWAARNGADVISCSWGPRDGDWWDPSDPAHDAVTPLPDSTRLAIDFAVKNGRNGKGCVVCWAAGNGNEPVENDGYASYGKVIAIAACNDKGKRAAYSDKGPPLWCSFPSSHGAPSVTPGIWTTDRSGNAGYNIGRPQDGDAAGNYTNSFGGTSSACPGAAGVAALVIARNPDLRWDEVKEIMKKCCDRIDPTGGRYDASGHSVLYGYGRLNARRAVELAAPATPNYLAIHKAVQDVGIRSLKTSELHVAVGDLEPIKDIKVHVDIEHTWIGDLVVELLPPAAVGVPRVVLHDRAGGSDHNISRTYDLASTPDLAHLLGHSPQGEWNLRVSDEARGDEGRIASFSLELSL